MPLASKIILAASLVVAASPALVLLAEAGIGQGADSDSWLMVTVLDAQAATADLLRSRFWFLAASLALFALGTLLAMYVAHRFNEPLRQLGAALKGLTDGNFDVKLEGSAFADAELSLLMSDFQTMRNAVQSREQGLRAAHAALQQLEATKAELVATVSHELRTPLTSIRGALALLTTDRLGPIPDKAKALIEIAHNNSKRLSRLIDDILDIEKIKAGQMTFAIQRTDVQSLLRDAAQSIASYADQYGVSIEVMPVAAGSAVRADPDRVAQALANLVSNAVKYSPRGSSVRLSASTRDALVRISVSDNGPGIPQAFRDRVFTRFSQADSTRARQKGGTGLGLSIAKAIAEAQGGAIGFMTAEGKGTTFFIDLPAAEHAGGKLPALENPIFVGAGEPDMVPLASSSARRLGTAHMAV